MRHISEAYNIMSNKVRTYYSNIFHFPVINPAWATCDLTEIIHIVESSIIPNNYKLNSNFNLIHNKLHIISLVLKKQHLRTWLFITICLIMFASRETYRR